MTELVLNKKSGGTNLEVGNPLLKITSGPAALAAPLFYETAELYLKIIGYEKDQAIFSVKMQADAAQAQANAQWAAAIALGVGTIVAGGLTLVGGIVSGKVAYKKTADPENNAEMAKLKEQMKPMKELNNLFDTEPQAKTGLGTNKKNFMKIKQRIKEIKDGKYLTDKSFKFDDTTKQAVAHIKASKESVKFKEDLRKNLEIKTNDFNARSSKTYSNSVNQQTTYQMWNGLFSGSSNLSNSVGSMTKGGQEANATLYSIASQQAAQIAQQSGKRMSEDYQNAINSLRTLGQVHQTNVMVG